MRLLLTALLALTLAGCAGSAREEPAPRAPRVLAADGSPLAKLPGLDALATHLKPGKRDARTAIRPALQRALAQELRGRLAAAVVVDVRTGRLLAAAGSGGRSPWRSLAPPGSTLKAVLAAGALSAGTDVAALDGSSGPGGVANAGGAQLGPIGLEEALVSSSNTAFADLAVRLSAGSVDALLARSGFDAPVRAQELRGLVRASRGAQLEEPGTHGVGNLPHFLDEQGRYRDVDGLGRTTTFHLGELALALASDGRRSAIGVTRAATQEGPWTQAAGRRVRPMLAAVVRRGTARSVRSPRVAIAAKTGSYPFRGRTALSLVGFAPASAPRVAVALTELGPAGAEAGPTLGPVLRRVLERSVTLQRSR